MVSAARHVLEYIDLVERHPRLAVDSVAAGRSVFAFMYLATFLDHLGPAGDERSGRAES